jgi:hypothetical protein
MRLDRREGLMKGAKVRKICLSSGIICELGGGCPVWLYTRRCTNRHRRLLVIGSTEGVVSVAAHGVC